MLFRLKGQFLWFSGSSDFVSLFFGCGYEVFRVPSSTNYHTHLPNSNCAWAQVDVLVEISISSVCHITCSPVYQVPLPSLRYLAACRFKYLARTLDIETGSSSGM